MKIEDLVELLNNRLREFKLSQNYALMNGDLEKVNTVDKEILELENTLFELNLLIDTSNSSAVKKSTLAEVLIDGSVAVFGKYDITPYATDPLHEEKVMKILSKMPVMDTTEKIDKYIKGKYRSSPVTGEMIISAAEAYSVDERMMMAIMEQDSRFGTAGVAVRTLNPGNVGNTDDGSTRTYDSWQEGVTAVAEWLSRHRVTESEKVSLEEISTTTSKTATSTPAITATSTPVTTATSTPVAATTTPPTATSTPVTSTTTPSTTATTTPTTATTTPETIIPIASSTPATTTPPIATSTPATTATSTPSIIISAPETTATSTPVTATTTPPTATSTPETTIPTSTIITTNATSTPVTTATSTPATDTASTSSPQATATEEKIATSTPATSTTN